MSGIRNRRGAFTLIELLVVIAIIALLVAMLMPMLGRAREYARLVTDQSNMRSVGQGFHFYVQQRQGRFPNKAGWDTNQGASSMWHWNPQSGWAPQWQSIINWEYYKGNDRRYYPTVDPPTNPGQGSSLNDEPTCGPIIRFWTFWSPTIYKLEYLKTRYTSCTNFRGWVSPTNGPYEWSRPYIANENATGGYDVVKPEGEYGAIMDKPQTVFPRYGLYALGTRPEQFANPQGKFLVFESEYGNETLQINSDANKGPTGTTTGTVKLNVNQTQSTSVPPWCAGASDGASGYAVGFFAFRHMLPPDTSLWQSSATATVLYVDGHAGTIMPNDRIATPARFMVDR